MKKLTTWLAAGLGALGVMFLSGAFERFFDWDAQNSKVGSGLFTVGVALAGAYLAHSTGIIDGNTRNMLIAAGVTLGAATAFGDKVYGWGEDLAGAVTKNRKKTRTANDGLHAGPGPDADYDGMGDPGEFMGPAAGTSPPPQPGGGTSNYYTIEAPDAPDVNPWVELGQAGIGAVGNVLGSVLGQGGALGQASHTFNLAGSGNRRRQMHLGRI